MGPILNAIQRSLAKAEDPTTSANTSSASSKEAERGDVNLDHETYDRQGRSCCGCLCDMRRAVIILSALGIVIQSATIGLSSWQIDSAKKKTVDQSERDRLDGLFTVIAAMSAAGMVFLLVAMLGGLLFRNTLVLPNAVYLPVMITVSIVVNYNVANDVDAYKYGPQSFVGSIIGMVLTEYVYLTFYQEVRNGILTKENYPNERQSCCCV